MKPNKKLATAQTPDGGTMELYQHDHDFLIRVNGLELMNSRRHESEMELARLGCAHLTNHTAPRILIGGLGMGYTLRQTLDMLGPDATVVVSELLTDVVEWNRAYLGELNGHPLRDQRVEIIAGDIFELIARSIGEFDAILLDIDNGPNAITDSGNQRLYSPAGIQACKRALRKPGCLAVWSSETSKGFEKLLVNSRLHVRRFRAASYQGSQSKPCFVWVAAEDKNILPPGGSEPQIPGKKEAAENLPSK